MANLIKYDKRVFLPSGNQKKFIESVQFKLGTSLDDIAGKIGVHRRTLFDWRREKFLISLSGLNKLSKISGLPVPQNVELKDPFWYVNRGSKIGWVAMLKKYGRVPVNEEYRKKKWYEWWEKEGKFKKHPIINVCMPFNKPKHSKELAEFIGIMMGDGGMSKRQICIILHHTDDLAFSGYVRKLIKRLFKVNPSIYHDNKNSVNKIVVSRTELVQYLNTLGLVIGNKIKQKFNIPSWIKENDSFLKMCIRGLIDTDGSIFSHKYKVNGKLYEYKKLCFSSASFPLNLSVCHALKRWGFQARLGRKNNEIREVRLDSKKDMGKYFKLIGSSNSKHLKRYKN